jgi:hypothetical protein
VRAFKNNLLYEVTRVSCPRGVIGTIVKSLCQYDFCNGVIRMEVIRSLL